MGMTKTGILFTTLFFYSSVSVLIGIYDSSTVYTTDTIVGFGGSIITGYASLGIFNLILFTPLVIILTWIIVTSFIPTINAGS